MLETLKKGIFLWMGALTLSEEEIKAHINDLVRRGEIKSKDARKVAAQAIKRAKSYQKKMQKYADEQISKQMAMLDKDSRMQIIEMKNAIVELEKKLERNAVMAARSAALGVLKATKKHSTKKAGKPARRK